jgi:hypothetical protein
MAKDFRLSAASANAKADAHTALLASGYLRIYAGTRAETGLTTIGGGHILLAEFDLAAEPFGAADGGVATAASLSEETAAATGTAAFYQEISSAEAVVGEGSVGVADSPTEGDEYDLELNSLSIVEGAPVTISSWTHIQPLAL